MGEKNLQTWLTTDISIEKPKKDPLSFIDAPGGRVSVMSGMVNCVGMACRPGGEGGLRVVGL